MNSSGALARSNVSNKKTLATDAERAKQAGETRVDNAMTDVRAREELPLYRLYVMRAAYLLLGLAQGAKTWPAIFHHVQPWDFWHGVGTSFFGALTLLSLVGVRYPVRMMPLLIFEFTWKTIWVLAAWLPPYLGHTLDPVIGDSFLSIALGVVVVPLVLPLGYLWKYYVLAPADRWR
jgi:hypothetical protein